jgi:hypothetical protein
LISGNSFRDFALDSEFTAVEETTEPIQPALDDFVAKLAGRPLQVTHRWAGIFGLVLDFLPVVGRVPGRGAGLGGRRLLGARQRARLPLRATRRGCDPRPARSGARLFDPARLLT